MYCIYHSIDLDGWCSAAIVQKWFLEKYPNGVVLDENNDQNPKPEHYLCMIGYNYGEPIPELIEKEKVIMVDISFKPEEMLEVAKKSGWGLTWIDHHISAINAFKNFINQGEAFCIAYHDTKYAACELTWKYFFPDKKMPEFVRLLGRYDCFGHKGTNEEQKVLEFQYAARAYCSNVKDCLGILNMPSEHQDTLVWNFFEKGETIYKYLCTEAKQIYNKRMTVDFDGYKFAVVNKERFNPINFGIQYHNDKVDDVYYYDGAACFHYEDGQWYFSLYNDNGEVDVSKICKKRGGGGHKGAAGFRIKELNFNSTVW